MRILFFGTATFAVPALNALLQSPDYEVIGVVTQPDKPHGRGGKADSAPVKSAAMTAGLPLYQPEKVRAKSFVETVRTLKPDVLVVAAFGQIIPQGMLDIPRFGSVNVHGSLLPRWRGAAPIQYALMAGDPETGVTTMLMDAGLDTGDMLLRRALPLTDDDNYGTVERKLADIGAPLLLVTLADLAAGRAVRVPQNPDLVTLAPSLPPDTGEFDWTRGAHDLHNLTRGVTPRPGAYAYYGGRRIKILKTRLAGANSDSHGQDGRSPTTAPGVIESVGTHGITVGTGKGALVLIEVQPESKARMAADAWARGARIMNAASFDVSSKT